jgi:hypothetical protein
MTWALSQPITTARTILHDPDATRYSDADLLQYANDALDQMVTLAPHLFNTEGEVECVAGKTLQSVSYADAHALVEVRKVKHGNVVTPTDRATLDAYEPDWHNPDDADLAVHWMPVANDPVRFLIYPAAPANQILEVIYTRIPQEYAAGDDTGLPATYSDAIADYIVHRAESRDDEHINANRAAQSLASFIGKVKGA